MAVRNLDGAQGACVTKPKMSPPVLLDGHGEFAEHRSAQRGQ